MMLQDISTTQWVLLAAAAVLVFWMVGAYNRLVALRNRIGAAWQQVHGALQRRDAVLQPLQAAIVGPLAAERGALDALGCALERARQAAMALATDEHDATRRLLLKKSQVGVVEGRAIDQHAGAIRRRGLQPPGAATLGVAVGGKQPEPLLNLARRAPSSCGLCLEP